jgi:hypothetical protein
VIHVCALASCRYWLFSISLLFISNHPDEFFALWLPALTGLVDLLISIVMIFAGLIQNRKQAEQDEDGNAEEAV